MTLLFSFPEQTTLSQSMVLRCHKPEIPDGTPAYAGVTALFESPTCRHAREGGHPISFSDAAGISDTSDVEMGLWEWRHFPDGESYVRVASDVQGKPVIILCSLNNPDTKTLALIFLARTLKELGAEKITLIAPYLGYMRQDKRFHDGEAITSSVFAAFLSNYVDKIVTIDPHLHRHKNLEEIYTCACEVLSATPLMAAWIVEHIKKPLIVGPDMESEQWVKQVAEKCQAPYVILEKTRHGDRNVEISLPELQNYVGLIPVLLDDIISTAATMIKAIELLRLQGFSKAICVATHGVFAENSFADLQKLGNVEIITTNTITHSTNGIDVAEMLLRHIK